MKFDLYQIDAFSDKIFGGNPACVVPLENWLPDDILLKITQENAVAETAFFVNLGDRIHLRWFTPEIEMDLCGHATLATAHVLISILAHPSKKLTFETHSGILTVTEDNGWYALDFPSRKPEPTALPEIIKNALSNQPKLVLKSRDYFLVYDTQDEIRDLKINRQILNQVNLDPGGVIITAKGNQCDFVSRFFTPQASILEDPVTGSAHCSLIPYWSERLNKKEMLAEQLSGRSGKIRCTDMGERVLISGQAKTYSIGSFWLD